MSEQELIANLGFYFEILVRENVTGSPLQEKQREKQFLHNVESNMTSLISEASKQDNVLKILQCYIRDMSEKTHIMDPLWNFNILALTLLKGLNEVLLAKGNQSTDPDISEGYLPVNLQNTIKKCLQQVVVIGILPNIIPSVRPLLKKRREPSNMVEFLDNRSTVQKKYYRLLTTLSVLLECLAQTTLREIILQQHSNDILATLLQLCYAPIKNLDVQNKMNDSQEGELKPHEMEKYGNFNWYLSHFRAGNYYTDEEFIAEMWRDRKYFQSCLANFLKKISLTDLMWQLLCLQGSSIGNETCNNKRIKVPIWLMHICNEMLTERLFDGSSLCTFIQMVAETMTATNSDSGRFGQERINAIATIISHNPVKHISLDLYMKNISVQLKNLLRTKDSESTSIFRLVAARIVLNFAQRNFDLAESVVIQTIFAPFCHCLHKKDTLLMDGDVIVSEEDLTICIEDAYEVFVNNHPVLSDEALKLLLPFWHLLSVIFVKLVNGISFLKSKVYDLLIVILNRSTSTDALNLLKAAIFEDATVSSLVFATNLKCIYGDDGGIAVVHHTGQIENFEEEINQKFLAITQLLSKISDKKVKTSFFLDIVKRTVHLDMGDSDDLEEKDVKLMMNVLLAVRLTEELADTSCEDLINNIEEAVEVIKVALESTNAKKRGNDDDDDGTFSDQTVLMFLHILNTLVGYKTQLKSTHWKALKQCLEPLQMLSETTINFFVKKMADELCETIRLEGVISVHAAKDETHHKKVSSEVRMEPKKLIEEITNFAFNSSQIVNLAKKPNHDEQKIQEKNLSAYHRAMLEAENDLEIPVCAHGLVRLRHLLNSKDVETLTHKPDLLKIFQKRLMDEDSYVYLPAILGLSELGDIDVEMVLPVLLSEFVNSKPEKWKLTLKCGEALMRICHALGELTSKYRDQFLNTFLMGVRHEDPQIRASSLSNLGEVCKTLRFSIGPMLQEIILCVTSILMTDQIIEVRRAAILVIVLLLRGTGKDTFSILGDELKNLYAMLKKTYMLEKDDVLRLHAQEGLVELDKMVKETFLATPLVKEIKIL